MSTVKAAARDPEEAEEPDDEASEEPLDQLGIPMRREPTIDDVRSDGRDHRNMALGCSVAVSLAVVLFWLVRVWMLGE